MGLGDDTGKGVDNFVGDIIKLMSPVELEGDVLLHELDIGDVEDIAGTSDAKEN